MDNTELLLKLKKEIDESKLKKAQIEGKFQTLEEQLKKEYNCNTIEEAEKLIQEIQLEIANKTQEFEKGIKEIEEYL